MFLAINSINKYYTAILMITSSQLCVYGCTTAGLDSQWKVPKINTEIAVTCMNYNIKTHFLYSVEHIVVP